MRKNKPPITPITPQIRSNFPFFREDHVSTLYLHPVFCRWVVRFVSGTGTLHSTVLRSYGILRFANTVNIRGHALPSEDPNLRKTKATTVAAAALLATTWIPLPATAAEPSRPPPPLHLPEVLLHTVVRFCGEHVLCSTYAVFSYGRCTLLLFRV